MSVADSRQYGAETSFRPSEKSGCRSVSNAAIAADTLRMPLPQRPDRAEHLLSASGDVLIERAGLKAQVDKVLAG